MPDLSSSCIESTFGERGKAEITDGAANNDEDIEKAIDLFAHQGGGGGGIITAFDALKPVAVLFEIEANTFAWLGVTTT